MYAMYSCSTIKIADDPIMNAKVKVLIVDDAAIMRRMLRDMLVSVGFEIAGEAGDGERAMEMIRQSRPDLVTLDITMPKKDGLTVLREIKALDRSIKVIMVSAMGQRENVIEAIKGGAENFIVKPFNADKILRVIKGLKLSPTLNFDQS